MKTLFLAGAMLAVTTAHASDCEYQRDIEVTLNLDGSDVLSVVAGAGDLEIKGIQGLSEARARGKVCASKREWLDQSEILTEGGRNAEITVSLPKTDSGWNMMGNRYVYMDLRIEVPDDIVLDVRDSSGDMTLETTGSANVSDSSGDIDIEGASGNIVLNDSSGDIDLVDIYGDVTVRQDSSGDIYGRNIQGSVIVEKDSSGDIRFRDVRDDYIVERDSSGDIVADSVGGDFRVLRDSSGRIRANGVSGAVEIPDKG